jgi:hypothetical protein
MKSFMFWPYFTHIMLKVNEYDKEKKDIWVFPVVSKPYDVIHSYWKMFILRMELDSVSDDILTVKMVVLRANIMECGMISL